MSATPSAPAAVFEPQHVKWAGPDRGFAQIGERDHTKSEIRFTLYKPRLTWRGFRSRYEISVREKIPVDDPHSTVCPKLTVVRTLERGEIRRPRNAPYLEFRRPCTEIYDHVLVQETARSSE